MKKVLFVLFICTGIWAQAQLTTGQMGPFRTGMTAAEIQKITGQTIAFSEEQLNTMHTYQFYNVQGTDYELYFLMDYDDFGNEAGWVVSEISSSNLKDKTAEGIGIGSSKDEIYKAFSNVAESMIFSSYYDDEGKRTKSRGFADVTFEDAQMEYSAYSFEILNNTVNKVSIFLNYLE